MPSPANGPEYNLTLRQADQARGDFAAILDELDLVKWQLARRPDRAWLAGMELIGFGSVWALLAAGACCWRGERGGRPQYLRLRGGGLGRGSGWVTAEA